jgi:hypothetical protein
MPSPVGNPFVGNVTFWNLAHPGEHVQKPTWGACPAKSDKLATEYAELGIYLGDVCQS